jgi:thiamine biosynthesis lipoprotein
MRLIGLTDAEAASVFTGIEAELRRLEKIFSLYSSQSALSRLNRDAVLNTPPAELLELLSLAREVHNQTGGLFDPTVQPLFRHYAEGIGTLEDALSPVGLSQVRSDRNRIAFDKPDMALTLNGIAQGYITDRVATMLRAEGFQDVLVDIGEIQAIGPGPNATGWRIGLAGPQARVEQVLQVSDRAVATSSPFGTVLDPAGLIGHILHPAIGAVSAYHRRVTVLHDSAAMADALSTAAALMDDRQIAAQRARGVEIVTG